MWISDLARPLLSLLIATPVLFHVAAASPDLAPRARPPVVAAPAPAPSLPEVAAAEGVRVLTVPPALAAGNATIEPSGIVWAPSLERYLVVSDDTGTFDDRHAPFVMAVSREGVFDAAPVPLEGLAALNDAEAICAGPGGTFFLTTSHSPNKEGKTHAARRMLLHLALEGRRLVVKGGVDLTSARAAHGDGLLAAVGLPVDGRLDIEAITYGRGALWIGFKSPLTVDGKAVIARLGDPVAVLARGKIPAGALTRAAAVSLRVPGPPAGQGPLVSQGIADMVLLPDGQFALAANAPKKAPPDGGGALYLYRPADERLVLVRRFLGLKPEGVTLGADGTSWVVVFDNDREAPSWATLGAPTLARSAP